MRINYTQNVNMRLNAEIPKNKSSQPQIMQNSPILQSVPAFAFRGNFMPTEKILPRFLDRLNGEIYETIVFDKIAGEKVKAFINYDNQYFNKQNAAYLQMYKENGLRLGRVKVSSTDWQNPQECSKQIPLNKPYLRLHSLFNEQKDKYSGIGSKLIQIAIEKSLKTDSEGRIYVFAYNAMTLNNDPFVFYARKHLSLECPDVNSNNLTKYIKTASILNRINEKAVVEGIEQICQKPIEQIKPDEKMMALYQTISKQSQKPIDKISLEFSEYMYLNDDAVHKFWIPEIKTNPLLSEQNRLR